MLNMSTAPLIFETAALSHQTSLQIRALKMMIAAKKMIQQQQVIQAGVTMDHSKSSNSNINNNGQMALPMSNSSSAPSTTMDSSVFGGGRNSSVSPGSVSPFASLSRDSPTPYSSRQQQQGDTLLSPSSSIRRSPPVQQQHSPSPALTSPTSSTGSSARLDRYSVSQDHHTSPFLKGRSSTTIPPLQQQSSKSPVHRYSTTSNSILSPPMSANSFHSSGARAMSMSPPSTPRQHHTRLDTIDQALPRQQQESKPKGKKDKMKGTAKSFFGGKLFS
jgi:hypothetical protein